MDWRTVWAYYWSCIYDTEENGTADVELMLSLLGEPKNVLEPCCGTGRVLAPLALAGHTVTGFDRDCGMLARLPEKIRGLANAKAYLMDALTGDWGEEGVVLWPREVNGGYHFTRPLCSGFPLWRYSL